MINGICWIVFSPISNKIVDTYHVSSLEVAMVAFIYMLMYAVNNFPANWLLDTKGLRLGIVLGTSFTCIGAAIRLFVNYQF